MSRIREITDTEQEAKFIADNRKCVIFFGAASCGHCVHMKPLVEEKSREYTNIDFAHVEVTKVKVENLPGAPIFVYYFNGIPFEMLIGAVESDFVKYLDELSAL